MQNNTIYSSWVEAMMVNFMLTWLDSGDQLFG